MRTYDPFVDSPGEKWFVFSDPSDCRRTQRIRKALLRSAKLIPVRSASAACSFAYFCCCNENAWLGVAAVVTAAPGHVKDLPSCAAAACAVLRLLEYLRFLTAGSCEHLANCHAGDHSSWNCMNCFCS